MLGSLLEYTWRLHLASSSMDIRWVQNVLWNWLWKLPWPPISCVNRKCVRSIQIAWARDPSSCVRVLTVTTVKALSYAISSIFGESSLSFETSLQAKFHSRLTFQVAILCNSISVGPLLWNLLCLTCDILFRYNFTFTASSSVPDSLASHAL